MKYCKSISSVMGSVLLFIMVSVFVPIYADAQDFDKPVAADIDEIITEYPAALFQLHLLLRPLHLLQLLDTNRPYPTSGIWSNKCSWFTIVSDGGYDFGLFSKQVVKMTLSAWLIL